MVKSKKFWNDEYKNPEHLTMSEEPSSDLITFVRWAEKNAEWHPFPRGGFILDIGCGNGRNIISLARESGMKGLGFDISSEAIHQAKKHSDKLPIEFVVQGAEEKLPVPDESVDVVLDMMATHFLNEKQRGELVGEIVRVMKPYGWLFFKTFILEGDKNAERLLAEKPAGEKNSYIHPKIGVMEHVWTEEEIYETFSPYFKIYKMIKSHKHIKDGQPHKRRTISVYMEKKRM